MARKVYYWQVCIKCGKLYPADRFVYVCTAEYPINSKQKCNGLLLVERDEEYIEKNFGSHDKLRLHFDRIRYSHRRTKYPYGSGVFQWLDILLPGFPDPKKYIVSQREGFTDLWEPPDWLKKIIGFKNLKFKLEGQAPSASFKDRGMPVAISEVIRLKNEYPELGIEGICCASTGDTSASAASYAAYCRDKLLCVVIVPEGKITGVQKYQSLHRNVIYLPVKNPRGFDGCMKLVSEFQEKHPELVLVNSKNAFRMVGQESISYEIFQDYEWKEVPVLVIPVGNAGNICAQLIAAKRALELGLIDCLPKVIIAQTEEADTMVRWFESGFTLYEPHAFEDSVASAMNINDPVSFPRFQKLFREFEIYGYRATRQETLDMWSLISAGGTDICPQGSVAMVAAEKALKDGKLHSDEKVVVLATALGLKFYEPALNYHWTNGGKYANTFEIIETSSLEAVNEAFRKAQERIKRRFDLF